MMSMRSGAGKYASGPRCCYNVRRQYDIYYVTIYQDIKPNVPCFSEALLYPSWSCLTLLIFDHSVRNIWNAWLKNRVRESVEKKQIKTSAREL